MANIVNRMKIMDGPSHVTLHCFLQSDGVAGELTNFVLLDPTVDVNPVMKSRQYFIVKRVWFELFGFTVTLAFNSLNPWPFWTFAPQSGGTEHDWRFFGGIKDNSSMPIFSSLKNPAYPSNIQNPSDAPDPLTGGINSDGKLLLTTNGFTSVSASGAMVLWLEKRDRPNPQPI